MYFNCVIWILIQVYRATSTLNMATILFNVRDLEYNPKAIASEAEEIELQIKKSLNYYYPERTFLATTSPVKNTQILYIRGKGGGGALDSQGPLMEWLNANFSQGFCISRSVLS